MLVVAVGMVQGASLNPREEAKELLTEVEQLESQLEDDRDKRELDNTNKRSFNSGYGAGYGAGASAGAGYATSGYGAGGYGYGEDHLVSTNIGKLQILLIY